MGFGTASARAVANNTPNIVFSNKTSAYTVKLSDDNKIINCTANSFTVSLPAATAARSGFFFEVWNSSATSTDIITIDPYNSETIDGLSTLSLQRGEGVQLICDGTNWQVDTYKGVRLYSENSSPYVLRPSAGDNSLALGYDATHTSRSEASGINAFAYAGLASGDYSIAIGSISSNTGALAIGSPKYATRATASNLYSISIGGDSTGVYGASSAGAGSISLGGSYTNGVASFAAINEDTSGTYGAQGANSVAIGKQTVSSGISAVALGNNAASTRYGKFAYASGNFASVGDAQYGVMVLRCTTTTASTTIMTSDAGAASTSNQIILPNDSTYFFRAHVVARRSDTDNECAAFILEGCADRNTTAGSVLFVGPPAKQILARDISAWDCNVIVDTTNGGLSFTVVGEASKTIKWVATVQTVEVTG